MLTYIVLPFAIRLVLAAALVAVGAAFVPRISIGWLLVVVQLVLRSMNRLSTSVASRPPETGFEWNDSNKTIAPCFTRSVRIIVFLP